MIEGVDEANVLPAKVGIEFTELIRRARITLKVHANSKVDREGRRRQIETQNAALAPK